MLYQHNEQARAALKYSSKKPTRRDARHQADETRKRHNHDMKRKQHTRDETDTTTIESRMWSIQAAVAYPRARSARTLRDPANLRARSVRAWKRCSLSSSTITKASNSSGRVLVTLVLVNPKQVHLVAGSTIISSLWNRDVRGQSSTIITSDRLSSPTPSFVVLSSQRLHPLPRPWKPGQ